MQLKDFLDRYGNILKEKVVRTYNPLYTPSSPDKWDKQQEEQLVNLKRKPFPAQKHAIIATAKGLFKYKKKGMIVVGEMGVGKTLIAIGVAHLIPKTKYRVIVMCPPHLVQKWIREIEETIPDATTFNLNEDGLKKLIKLKSNKKAKGKEFYILSREKAKLHYENYTSIWELKHLKTKRCPHCGQEIEKLRKKRPLCNSCNQPLYSANNNKLRRFALGEYIKKYLKGKFDLFIADEVHELKGGTTAQGQAFACIAAAAKKTLALTGTLMGGYSTNLFYILWRLIPNKMAEKKLDFRQTQYFAERYGILEKTEIEKKEEEYNKQSIGRSKGRVTVKEQPGISPLILPDFLLEHCVFLKLSDISNALPPYKEEIIEIDMLEEQQQAYFELETKLYEEVRRALYGGDHSLLGALVNSLLAYPDGARKGEIVIHPHKKTEIVFIPPIEADWLPKEKKLIDIVKQELKKGRKCLVYLEHTGTRDLTGELLGKFQRENIKAYALKSSTVTTEKREKWIKQAIKHHDVMITNPKLVQTGLDLIEFPTIIFFQTGYSIFTLRQASRRSWRIGQKLPIKVFYLTYNNTIQSRALSLIAQKLETALAVEGDLSDKGLVTLSKNSNSILYDLARNLIENTKVDNLSEAWEKYKKKELHTDSFLDEEEQETITTTIQKGNRSVSFSYTHIIRGRIFPQKDFAVALVGKNKFIFKQGQIYYKNKICGLYDKNGKGKINNKPILIKKLPQKPYYLLIELKQNTATASNF